MPIFAGSFGYSAWEAIDKGELTIIPSQRDLTSFYSADNNIDAPRLIHRARQEYKPHPVNYCQHSYWCRTSYNYTSIGVDKSDGQNYNGK